MYSVEEWCIRWYRKVAHQLQDSCTRVPRPSWSGACVRVNADYVIRTTSRLSVSMLIYLCHRFRFSYHQRIVDIVPDTFEPLVPKKPVAICKYEKEGAGRSWREGGKGREGGEGGEVGYLNHCIRESFRE